ncbi:hypothetical protein DI09_77p60 [Mitosporidium daphniae]|uniref:Uncharacterized protein n=1 Tax=Mitosporidium daphniae TaxID=1485682 RepID=A0A098VRG3_9MICR|nr:uncharacterized protein DI09_77p60 [Mitosporidium daphniae]KGG50316.1 hypothetical protein DI09_77p60 [Mitosporidium daphniae]|eukprot:XP_013236759.1 uncharacterized protein DI09_77p60 [Mitosporidium daphniae]
MHAFDASTNVAITHAHERIFSLKKGVVVSQLGLFLIRGDNIHHRHIGRRIGCRNRIYGAEGSSATSNPALVSRIAFPVCCISAHIFVHVYDQLSIGLCYFITLGCLFSRYYQFLTSS